jgi:hypothetical protein
MLAEFENQEFLSSNFAPLQSTFKIQILVGFRIQFYASPGHLKTGQKCLDFEWSRLDCFIIKKKF